MTCAWTRITLVAALIIGGVCDNARAQNWSFDARKIALGGSSNDNIATEMVVEEQPYRAIVLPFGLLQVLGDFDKFDPGSDKFDLVRAIEYAASPLHFIVGRGTTDTGETFVTDIRNAGLNRNLNAYRGFVPANEVRAEGLSSPSWGKTFKFRQGDEGTFHGIRVGAGPYLSMRTLGTIDPKLTTLLASEIDVFLPNTQFLLTDGTQGQAALAIVGGYRGRLAWPGSGAGSGRDGIYVALDYNYLHGFRLQDVDLTVRLDTDGAGLIIILPSTTPIVVDHVSATSGRGMAIDLGLSAVVSQWEFGFGANGISNHLDWTDAERQTFTLNSLVSGDSEFIESPKTAIGDLRVELSVDYRGNVGFTTESFAVLAEIGHGFQGTSFHGGVERKFEHVALRGGARYGNDKWNPTGGVGFNLTERIGLDVAAFGTTANIERKRQLAIAASIRINRRP